VIEGNHGLFDSVAEDGSGSSAAVAQILDVPILLVINGARMGRSAAAMVHGYQTFEANTSIAGVVLNNVVGKRHEAKMRAAIESHCGIPVVGAIPRDQAISIPDRHLGLVPRAEDGNLVTAITACRTTVERFVDIEAVMEISCSGSQSTVISNRLSVTDFQSPISDLQRPALGIIRDQVFTFYYPENLEALERAGGWLTFIDAQRDTILPAVDALYIGGGFPEMFLEQLEENQNLRQAIRAAIEDGLPVYAECGGLMYLSKRIHYGDLSAEMVGALPCEVELSEQPQGHGYVQAEVVCENPFWSVGTQLRGHEFHNSRLTSLNGIEAPAYRLARGSGLGNGRDGLVYRNVLASYTHLHADGSPVWAEGLVSRARKYAQERRNG
jgi:cobyrinic acid a,c-diamide synthase